MLTRKTTGATGRMPQCTRGRANCFYRPQCERCKMQRRHQTRSRGKPRASSADVLSAPVGTARRIPGKWRTHYQNLVCLRSELLARAALIGRDLTADGENPISSNHIADAATDEFDRDLALTIISSEQDA